MGLQAPNCHTWLIIIFLVETGFHHIGQVDPELLTSGEGQAVVNRFSEVISDHSQPQGKAVS